ncbi:uncharacterized protein LOC126905995 isoform X2 [Daktulosphaira vitifoliae]|uniref:uncharacterized protein LOC126905995 isoform X1 n=1 Tax=Daktulosphaira vitifoliae TaxID=58002 RepID=UPI0021A9DACA|nr:uncharacterized protein LOC126905995 isoform X1 [Daktulosphaira vitifoliae]XP_050542176.1 uncharacterized protein LOC126905995 isoform X2 [Daktulosphaira vitifoliae]
MHLKTILIFCSVGFFTDTMGEGLNALQIQCVQVLMKNHNIPATITKFFDFFRPTVGNSEYVSGELPNMYDDPNVGIFEILKMLGAKVKRCDARPIEKLKKDEVEDIANKFDTIDKYQNRLINNEEYIRLIDLYRNYINNVEMINEWKRHIDEDNNESYDLGDVMLELLRYRAQLKNTVFGKEEDLEKIKNVVLYLSNNVSHYDISEYYSLY